MCEKDQITVSVIIPTYNRARVLGDAIQSVLEQTYAVFELIVVDDGSTDGTETVVRGLCNRKIRYIRHPENRGVSAALNTGVQASTGEWIGLLDSDDLWHRQKLDRQVELMFRHPAADFLFADAEILDGSRVFPSAVGLARGFRDLVGSQSNDKEYFFTGRDVYLCLLEDIPIKRPTVLIRRTVFDRVGLFNEGWRSGEDWEHLLRLAPSSSFGYTNLPLARIRRMPDATHKLYREQDKSCLLSLFLEEKKLLARDMEALRRVNRGISDHCNNLGFIYLSSGRRAEAVRVYVRGFKETREPVMLARALAALLPLGTRQSVRGMLRKGHSTGV